jgi:hypothetical protein
MPDHYNRVRVVEKQPVTGNFLIMNLNAVKIAVVENEITAFLASCF